MNIQVFGTKKSFDTKKAQLVDPKAKDADTVSLLAYLSPDQKFDKLLENQHVLAEPVVRNGKQATVGYAPDVWKTWE